MTDLRETVPRDQIKDLAHKELVFVESAALVVNTASVMAYLAFLNMIIHAGGQ